MPVEQDQRRVVAEAAEIHALRVADISAALPGRQFLLLHQAGPLRQLADERCRVNGRCVEQVLLTHAQRRSTHRRNAANRRTGRGRGHDDLLNLARLRDLLLLRRRVLSQRNCGHEREPGCHGDQSWIGEFSSLHFIFPPAGSLHRCLMRIRAGSKFRNGAYDWFVIERCHREPIAEIRHAPDWENRGIEQDQLVAWELKPGSEWSDLR